MFDLTGKTALVTGGSGVLGGAMARALANAGAAVAILGTRREKAEAAAAQLSETGARAIGVAADVTDRDAMQAAADGVIEQFGAIDILVNAAGGNRPAATTSADRAFADLVPDDLRAVMDLNWMGTVIPSQIVGAHMAARGTGSIINISSMAAIRPLTRVVAYGGAKAAVNHFTQWLAVYMAATASPAIRVNAIAPGFFLGEQNRALLIDATSGDLTPRGRQILDHTPMARFGEPDDLAGAVVWLASNAARFVTGIVVPIDGGFSASSGV